MRLISRRIYRAFAELDPYSDEQCIRFVDSARRGPLITALHTTAILAVTLPLLCLALAGTVYLFETLSRIIWLRRPFAFEAAWILSTALMFAFACGAGLVVRDMLLRRRLRYVLRSRGTCPACQYSLVGLEVSPRSTVACPECGVEVEVDASLAELTREGDGKRFVTDGTP